MTIKTKLTEKDFINANFVVLFSKISMKIFTGMILFSIIVTLLTALFSSNGSITQVIAPLVMFSFIAFLIYFSVKKSYATNQRASETIEYQFNDDNLLIKGESFDSKMTWDKVYKVTQTKNWILIWHNKQIAHPIPKRDLWDEQIENLKGILAKNKVKNNL